jgi:hypothetical protein
MAVSLNPEVQRRYTSAHSRVSRTHLLSNGRYSVMVTSAGSGYSRWHDVAITRWREDVTCDGWGAYVFLRDLSSGETWSAAYQPSVTEPDAYEVTFSEGRAGIVRRDGAITTTLEIAVSPEDDAEVRRVSITNHGPRTREIELTSYAEIALARQPDDLTWPIPPLPNSSSRPNSCPILARSWRRGGSAHPAIRWYGLPTLPWSRAKRQTTCSLRPIGRGSSVVGKPSDPPQR